MCGICGIFDDTNSTPVEPRLLERMTDRMRHRGPDDAGIYHDGAIGLGHRRLSIVDVAGGRQPMATADESIHVVFNGEIYNHEALRAELEAKGHRFRTRSDTESILYLYQELGEACLERLDGMFALAIWDSRHRRLLLARDRLGIKPLYYASVDGTLIFASEIKSLLLHPAVSRELDPVALDSYLALQYVPTPRTIFSAVRKLPAGHLLLADEKGVESREYWTLEPAAAPATFAEGCDRFRVMLEDAVAARLMSDVPLGVFLSGGLDSSLVVAMMARRMDRPVDCYSIGFDGGGWHSELPYAELVAQRLGAKHHTHIVRATEMQELLGTVLEQLDEPLADPAAIPTYLLSAFARKNVTVCLTGEGADELFAGYRRYVLEDKAQRGDWLPRAVRAGLASVASPFMPDRLRKPLRSIGLDQPDRFVFLRSVIPPHERRSLLRAELAEQIDPRHLEERMSRHFHSGSGLNEVLRADTGEWLADDLLMKVDKMSMLASLEARVPFLDHRLVELVAGYPAKWKYGRGQSKLLLKEVARGLIPDEVIDRPKHGFMPPVQRWLCGELSGFLEECLLDPQALSYGYLRESTVRDWIERFRKGQARMDLRVWILLCLEVWLRRTLNRPAA